MKAINNVVVASKNIINAATSTVSVSAQVVADGTELLNDSVTQAPLVLKALLTAPFAAAKGYIMESEGVSEQVAEARAYRFIKQSLSTTIEEVGVGSGKLLADLLKEEDLDAAVARIEPVGPVQQ
jgi:hypothetical protein